MTTYGLARSVADYAEAERLFRGYAEELGIDLGFQGFEEELRLLHVVYAPPAGGILLARSEDAAVGCLAIRPHREGVGELKRMFVHPSCRRQGIGQELLTRILDYSRGAGYARLVLDTLEHMTPALSLYEANGFRRMPAYYANPHSDAVYLEKVLRG